MESQLISVGDTRIIVIVDEVLDFPVLEAHLLERPLVHVVSLIFAYLLVLLLSQLRGVPAVITRLFGRTLDDIILAVLASGGGVFFRTAACGASLVFVDQEVGLDGHRRRGDRGVIEDIAVSIIRLNFVLVAKHVAVRIVRLNFFVFAIGLVLLEREFVFLLVDFICSEQGVVDVARDQLELKGAGGPVNRNGLLGTARARGTSTAALLLVVLRNLFVVSSESSASL